MLFRAEEGNLNLRRVRLSPNGNWLVYQRSHSRLSTDRDLLVINIQTRKSKVITVANNDARRAYSRINNQGSLLKDEYSNWYKDAQGKFKRDFKGEKILHDNRK